MPSTIRPSAVVIVVNRFVAVHAQDIWTVLIHQRADNDWWAFPGGGMHIGESIEDCAKREVYEETGLSIWLEALVCVDSDPTKGAICVYPDQAVQYCCLTFLGGVMAGTLRRSQESRIVRWCQTDHLPTPFLLTHLRRLEYARHFLATRQVTVC